VITLTLKAIDVVLAIMMAIDILMGLITAFAGKSTKSKTAWFNSEKFREGICKKAGMFFYVVVSILIDYLLGESVIHTSVACLFIANEAMSILENGALLGIPLPKKLTNALEVLKGLDNSNESEVKKNG
jgi:toxin secretion/phage lysis holin